MEKRVLLAFFLSALVLAAWSYFFAPPPLDSTPPPDQPVEDHGQPPRPPETEEIKADSGTSSSSEDASDTTSAGDSAAPSADFTETSERLVRIESPFYRATFSNRGAVAVSWTIKKLTTDRQKEILGADDNELELIPQSEEVLKKLGAPFGLVAADEQLTRLLNTAHYVVSEPDETLSLGASESRELVFSLRRNGVEIQKKFVFSGDRFDFKYSVAARRGNQPVEMETILGPNFGDQSVIETGAYIAGPQVTAAIGDGNDDTIERIPAESPSTTELGGQLNWVGVDDNYFALAFVPRETIHQTRIRRSTHTVNLNGTDIERQFIAAVAPTPPGQEHTVFAGPKDPLVLAAVAQRLGKPSFEYVINYGFMTSIIEPIINHVLMPALKFTYRLIPNYGVVILLVTFVINMLFFPLKWKGSIKMKKAQAMQPKMKEMQQKLKGLKKDDPQFQELQMEQIRLMREANPFGGCLPMLAQIPVFWAFFILLTVSIEIRQEPFVSWISNLSAPDTLLLGGIELHVLPIAMCISWMAQTFLTPGMTPGDPTQQAQQRIQKILMGVVMPVVFTVFFFWRAPSGLVLYWMFNSLVGAGQQVVINRLMPEVQPEAAKEEPIKAIKKKKQKKAALS